MPRRADRDQPLPARRHGLGAALQPLLTPEDDREAAPDPPASRRGEVGTQHATGVQPLARRLLLLPLLPSGTLGRDRSPLGAPNRARPRPSRSPRPRLRERASPGSPGEADRANA